MFLFPTIQFFHKFTYSVLVLWSEHWKYLFACLWAKFLNLRSYFQVTIKLTQIYFEDFIILFCGLSEGFLSWIKIINSFLWVEFHGLFIFVISHSHFSSTILLTSTKLTISPGSSNHYYYFKGVTKSFDAKRLMKFARY